MKQLFVLLLLANFTFANDGEGYGGSDVLLEKSEKDLTLKPDESVFRFKFNGISDTLEKRVIIYSIDGLEKRAKLIDNVYFEVTTTLGEHSFQFYYDEHHTEVTSDTLVIKAQYRDVYSVLMRNVDIPYVVGKPVIYLYPTEATDVNVEVLTKGQLSFAYPEYNGTWEFTATPQGELKFEEATYNYLFWEADQYFILSPEENQNGFICAGENAVSFLEEKLTLAGLTSQEKADFITFWGPRLQRNELNYVHFMFNEECDAFAELSISPKPDHVYRIYMVWSPVESEVSLVPQTIIPMDRSGFSVLEWGGMEQAIIENIEINEL
ncbi:MAG: hypothetical protein QNK23_05885 [Crocinitomicaceae bacterium]|nr:hypothetical protein [Crocinitomicaceae bacterium]